MIKQKVNIDEPESLPSWATNYLKHYGLSSLQVVYKSKRHEYLKKVFADSEDKSLINTLSITKRGEISFVFSSEKHQTLFFIKWS